MFWFSQNQSVTTAVLCSPLHCHQFKWIPFENGKVRKFDICSSTISEKANRWRQTERKLEEYTLCPSVVFFCRDQVHLACRICNEPLLFVTDIIPPRPHCWLRLLSSTECEEADRKMERQNLLQGMKSFLIIHALTFSHLISRLQVFLHSQSLSAVSGTYIVVYLSSVSLCVYHICPPVPLFVSGVVSDISVQTMKL